MSDEPEFGLVMPFVVVTSVGGPYDDESYCAGFEAGKLDNLLEMGASGVSQIARTANVAQLDLIAMRHGCVLESQDHDDGWSDISVRNPDRV